MAHVLSWQPVPWRPGFLPYGIYGGLSGAGTGFCLKFFSFPFFQFSKFYLAFPCRYCSTKALHTHVSSWELTKDLRYSLTPSM
jgi:hypothetical protein